jgi:hypothetical protein
VSENKAKAESRNESAAKTYGREGGSRCKRYEGG